MTVNKKIEMLNLQTLTFLYSQDSPKMYCIFK